MYNQVQENTPKHTPIDVMLLASETSLFLGDITPCNRREKPGQIEALRI
jgi:hypothetical protein